MAQEHISNKIFTAFDQIIGIQAAAVQSESIGAKHVVIIDGIEITNQLKLRAALEGIFSNSIMDYSVLSKETAKNSF